MLCGCHSPVRGSVCSPIVGVEATRSGSKLCYEVAGTGAYPLGKKQLHVLPQELSTGTCDSVMLSATWCARPQSLLLLVPGPTSAMGAPIISSGIPQASMHTHKATDTKTCHSHAPTPTVGALVISSDFNPPLHVHPQSSQDLRQPYPCTGVSTLMMWLWWTHTPPFSC